jgi:hypothetical protein
MAFIYLKSIVHTQAHYPFALHTYVFEIFAQYISFNCYTFQFSFLKCMILLKNNFSSTKITMYYKK